MSPKQKINHYEHWARNRRAERVLFGTPFEEPVKEDGSHEDDINILWDFYVNHVKQQLANIKKQLEEIEGK